MKNPIRLLFFLCLLLPGSMGAQDPGPVVHALLFYSPTCPHCHQVITEYLIPLQNRFGNSLVILGMDTTKPEANNLWWETIRKFRVPEENWAVPFLVVGEEVLVGGIEIPNRFTTIVEEGLAAGGIDLPDYPALRTFLEEQDLLDPRFPDRLVIRPAPGPQAEEESPEPERTVEAEEVDSSAGAVGVDTARTTAQGSVAGMPAVDSTRAGEPGGASLEDTLPAAQARDPGAASPEDTVHAGQGDAAAVGGDPGAGAQDPATRDRVAVEAAGGEGRGGGVAAAVEGESTVSSQAAERDTAAASAEGLVRGLDEAASDFEAVTVWDRFGLDPAGNGLSVLVLLVMISSLGLRGYPPGTKRNVWPAWTIPALVVMGVFVAGYLSFVEVTQVEAVCGPVGDCNTVNQSEYAMLFGVLPVGLLGLAGYAVILLLWVVGRGGPAGVRKPATLGLWAAVLFGVLFSVYLTFLEPFVIGASCAWCLTSAMIMTLLLWATAPLAARAWPEKETTRGDG